MMIFARLSCPGDRFDPEWVSFPETGRCLPRWRSNAQPSGHHNGGAPSGPAGFEPAFRHRVQQQSPRMHGLVAPWIGLPRRPRFRLMALPQKLCHVAVSNHALGRGEPVAHHDHLVHAVLEPQLVPPPDR